MKSSYTVFLVAPLRLHRDRNVVLCSEFDRARVAGVCVTENAWAWVAGETALKTAFGIVAALGDDHHPGVLRKSDANAAAVVHRHLGCACRRVNQRIHQR